MEISLAQLLLSAGMIGLRVTGLMLFAPFFGNAAISPQVKAVLVVAITAVLFPVYSPHIAGLSLEHWPVAVASELAVGLALGLATNLMFEAVLLAGQILSIQMGYSLVNILDPTTQVETTVVSVFHQTLAMLIFLRLDVHHWILRGIGKSFEYLPPGMATVNAGVTNYLLHGAAGVLEAGIQIAAPVLAATLVADVVLGFLGKASPQLPLMLLGPGLKSIMGTLILAGALSYWPALFERRFTESIVVSERLLHLAR